jgi:DNA-binding transcriptional LysR family regulator
MSTLTHLSNITFLRYFYAAAKHKSMTKAAKSSFVTQSAISQGIDKLEKAFGKKLLSNRKNRFELTLNGELLLAKCEAIFRQFDELDDLFNEQEGIYRGKFLFAMSHSFAISLLPQYYKELFDTSPAIEPLLRLGHSGIVREWVTRSEVEFGLILKREKDSTMFTTCDIFNGTFGMYKTKAKLLSDKLIISEDSYEDSVLVDYLRTHTKKPISYLEVLSWEVIANMVKEGLGIGILPDYVAKRHNFIHVPTKIPKLPYQIVAISSQKKELSRNSKMFIELMQKQHF